MSYDDSITNPKIDGSKLTPTWGNNIQNALAGLAQHAGPSFIVYKIGATYYADAQYTGLTDDTNADFSTLIHACNDALVGIGGIIYLAPGKYTANSTILLNSVGVKLIGSGGWGDFHLTSDANAGTNFYPRNATLIVDGTQTLDPVIQVGNNVATPSDIAMGIHLSNFAITGHETWTGDLDWGAGAGIKVYSGRAGDTINRVSVYRKAKGIELQERTIAAPNEYLMNNEGMILEDLQFAYCDYGLNIDSSFYDSHVKNVRGYYCYHNLISQLHTAHRTSHVMYHDITGQMCGYEATEGAGMSIIPSGAIDIIGLKIDNNVINPPSYAGVYGLYLNVDIADENVVVNVIDPVIHGVTNGIGIGGGHEATINIVNPYIGLHEVATLTPLGGSFGVADHVVLNLNTNAGCKVYVTGGACRANSNQQLWFSSNRGGATHYSLESIRDVRGFNPYGRIVYPWNNTTSQVGLPGLNADSLTSDTGYVAAMTDLLITFEPESATAPTYAIYDDVGCTPGDLVYQSPVVTVGHYFLLPMRYVLVCHWTGTDPLVRVAGI